MTKKSGKPKTHIELAKAMGVTRHSIGNWMAMGAPKRDEDGFYDVEAVQKWREANIQVKGQKPRNESFDKRMADAKLREQEAKAEKTESEAGIQGWKLRMMGDDVVYLHDVEEFLASAFTQLRKQIDRLPDSIATRYPENIQDMLRDDLREQLGITLRSFHGHVSNLTQIREEVDG